MLRAHPIVFILAIIGYIFLSGFVAELVIDANQPATTVPDEPDNSGYKIRWDEQGRRYMQRDGQWHVWSRNSEWLPIPDSMLPKNLSAK